MLPILFKIGPYSFSSLGTLVALGFFIGFFLIWRRLREIGFEEERTIDAFLFASLSALLFSRLFYIVQNLPSFGFQLVSWFYFHRFPGFSFWGAILGFLMGFAYFAKKEKWNFLKMADELVFGLMPFAIFVQLGMFFDGNNLGGETGMFWGLFFPGDMVRRHPISLFQAFFYFLFWLYFLRIETVWRSWEWYKSKKEGFLIFNFLILVFFSQFLLAFLKPGGLYSVVVERVVSGLVCLVSLGGLYWRSGRKLASDFSWFPEVFAFLKRGGKKSGPKGKKKTKN